MFFTEGPDMSDIPRPEHPRPQFVRDDWLNLNGQWQFEIDRADTGIKRGLLEADLATEITVPFCPESPLSGIGDEDFILAMWYRREVTIPAAWEGKCVHLHFQAVDYDTTVWVNGQEITRHRGGWSPFTADLSRVAGAGETITIVVRARDDNRHSTQPGGKQTMKYERHGSNYTRTSGIWQTVWLEAVPPMHLKRPRITPELTHQRFSICQPVSHNAPGTIIRATASFAGERVAQTNITADKDYAPTLELPIPDEHLHLWDVGEGNLYDITLELLDADGEVVDMARSYAGMRSITLNGKEFRINGRKVFQRQVLDQGYYPDGIMTAATDAVLRGDIELAIAAGFNSARLHQKVFEERFLYHADQLGYLVWGEFGDRGISRETPPLTIVTQWLEVLERDYNHPSIVGWCALNETAQKITDDIQQLDDMSRGLFLAAKGFDTTRPVIDASGYSHRVYETDVYDSHHYAQNPAELAADMEGLDRDNPYVNITDWPASLPYNGQPYFVSEFGGILWADTGGWGYGDPPKTLEEYYERFEGLCNVLLDNPFMFGYCYTQLTDVFQEQNGIYFFDRSEKFDMERIRAIQTRSAAYEKEA
jgi:beta-galactosidase/beta-glucuronidase